MKVSEVEQVFSQYPEKIRQRLLVIRTLIFETAESLKMVAPLTETIKWGEPAYLCPGASTVRLGWKKSQPDEYYVYFNCKTKLVDTFKEIYPKQFQYSGNRAIVLNIRKSFSQKALMHCIALSLTYHKIKHLPLLGV